MTGEPVRRKPSPAVYRRRRLFAGVLAIIVVAAIAVGIWLLVAQPWSNDDADPVPATSSSPSPTSTPSTTPSDAAVPSGAPDQSGTGGMDGVGGEDIDESTPPEAEPCTTADLRVEALTDKSEYGTDEQPQLSIRLTNESGAACTLDVGTATQSFEISSGEDVWWRSTDCQAEPSSMVVTLAAGQVVESATPLAWDRTRSSVDTCDGDRPTAPGGGASYHLSVEIGGVAALETRQFFLL